MKNQFHHNSIVLMYTALREFDAIPDSLIAEELDVDDVTAACDMLLARLEQIKGLDDEPAMKVALYHHTALVLGALRYRTGDMQREGWTNAVATSCGLFAERARLLSMLKTLSPQLREAWSWVRDDSGIWPGHRRVRSAKHNRVYDEMFARILRRYHMGPLADLYEADRGQFEAICREEGRILDQGLLPGVSDRGWQPS